MTSGPHPVPRHSMTVAVDADGGRARLTFPEAVDAAALRELEERLAEPPLSGADEWVLDMSAVTRIDLASAYALLRAATQRPNIVKVTIRGAPRTVQRTLRQAGLDAVASIQE
ncbi:STAS domain-containing protein [Streptomyces sp. NPDC020801]|uniref:STAS domain-containing protein n=1 Tax=unclassified Streptomyces TaxID=2593676 RepID=UPI0037B53319